MIYIDTSSLLKTIMKDEHSDAVLTAITQESHVVITPLTNLEAVVQIRGLYLGGRVSKARLNEMMRCFNQTITEEPYIRMGHGFSIFRIAVQQHESAQSHCRSLDRLHLAAMAELSVTRLMTHDGRQALAARELGYEVMMPGTT